MAKIDLIVYFYEITFYLMTVYAAQVKKVLPLSGRVVCGFRKKPNGL